MKTVPKENLPEFLQEVSKFYKLRNITFTMKKDEKTREAFRKKLIDTVIENLPPGAQMGPEKLLTTIVVKTGETKNAATQVNFDAEMELEELANQIVKEARLAELDLESVLGAELAEMTMQSFMEAEQAELAKDIPAEPVPTEGE